MGTVMNSAIRVEVTRGHDNVGHLESLHEVHAVVCDDAGQQVCAYGEETREVFPRSAIKSLQALPLIESGAADAFGFDDAELALACSSHNGEPFQSAAAQRMLKKAGLEPRCLECGAQLPYHPRDHETLIRAGEPVTALHNNCSGKHAGFLAFAAHTGLPTKGYVGFSHPVQREIAAVLETVTGAVHGEDNYGLDGCSIPTYSIPLARLAAAYGRFSAGRDPSPARSAAMLRLRDACMAHPEMVAGTDRFDTLIMQALPGRVFTKTGAEGVFVACLPELGIGLALKCVDGATRAAETACAFLVRSLLERSSAGLDDGEAAALRELENPILRNRNGWAFGTVRVALDTPSP